jgi:hypothetical protein
MEEKTVVVIADFSGGVFLFGRMVVANQRAGSATSVGRLNHPAVVVAAA